MARGEDTGHHPGRNVSRERFSAPSITPDLRRHLNDKGVTPGHSFIDIADAIQGYHEDRGYSMEDAEAIGGHLAGHWAGPVTETHNKYGERI